MRFVTRLALCSLLSLGLTGAANAHQQETHSDYPWPMSGQYLSSPSILVFSATRAWRHEEAIPFATALMHDIAGDVQFSVHSTEDSRIFNAQDLARFKVIVFNNVTGDALTPHQEKAFQAWLEAGGGLVAVHGSGDSSHLDWPWYQKEVIGPLFIGHPAAPQFQEARLEVLAPAHPVTSGIPAEFLHTDEWYSFDRATGSGAVALVGLDETTYSPKNEVYGPVSDLRMGPTPAEHPVVWARCMGEGRVVYSALGHNQQGYKLDAHQKLLRNAVDWTAKRTDPESEGCAKAD